MTDLKIYRISIVCTSMLIGLVGHFCRAESVDFVISGILFEEPSDASLGMDFAADRIETQQMQLDPDIRHGIVMDAFDQPEPALAKFSSPSIWQRISRDYSSFYHRDALIRLISGFGVGGVIANTSIDREIHRRFQSSVRSAESDDWFEYLHASKEMGNSIYTVPVLATSWVVGDFFNDASPVMGFASKWGERSCRGYAVGVPHLLAFQLLTGGSRPGERSDESHWRTFADDNGVSGHSFISALPFITAAKMADRPVIKGAYYLASAIGPLSRVNDDAHYPSQAFLGWWVAFAAASAVERTDSGIRSKRLRPYANGHSAGIAAEVSW